MNEKKVSEKLLLLRDIFDETLKSFGVTEFSYGDWRLSEEKKDLLVDFRALQFRLLVEISFIKADIFFHRIKCVKQYLPETRQKTIEKIESENKTIIDNLHELRCKLFAHWDRSAYINYDEFLSLYSVDYKKMKKVIIEIMGATMGLKDQKKKDEFYKMAKNRYFFKDKK